MRAAYSWSNGSRKRQAPSKHRFRACKAFFGKIKKAWAIFRNRFSKKETTQSMASVSSYIIFRLLELHAIYFNNSFRRSSMTSKSVVLLSTKSTSSGNIVYQGVLSRTPYIHSSVANENKYEFNADLWWMPIFT